MTHPHVFSSEVRQYAPSIPDFRPLPRSSNRSFSRNWKCFAAWMLPGYRPRKRCSWASEFTSSKRRPSGEERKRALRWCGGDHWVVCGPGRDGRRWMSAGSDPALARTSAPRRVAMVDSLSGPEALELRPHPGGVLRQQRQWHPRSQGRQRFISRVGLRRKMDSLHFIQAAETGGAQRAHGIPDPGRHTLAVDIDAVRAFDTGTGRPLTSIDLSSVHPCSPTISASGRTATFTSRIPASHQPGRHLETRPRPHLPGDRDGQVTSRSSPPPWMSRRDRVERSGAGLSAGTDRRQAIQTGSQVSERRRAPPGRGRFDGLEVERDGRVRYVLGLTRVSSARVLGFIAASARSMRRRPTYPWISGMAASESCSLLLTVSSCGSWGARSSPRNLRCKE